jgi:hypothetical protein
MIKFREQVPSVYTDASRDFQYLTWLFDIVLNSVKHNVDNLYDLPNTKIDSRLTELLAMTLGFKVKRNYDQKQLAALVAVLPRVLKYKGTIIAIDTVCNALIGASGSTGNHSKSISKNELKITLPKGLIDVSLVTDLIPYILPAGMTCRIERKDQIVRGFTDKYYQGGNVYAKWVPDITMDDTEIVTGLSAMLNPETKPVFANFVDKTSLVPNIGLLSNTIIPDFDYTDGRGTLVSRIPLESTKEAEQSDSDAADVINESDIVPDDSDDIAITDEE